MNCEFTKKEIKKHWIDSENNEANSMKRYVVGAPHAELQNIVLSVEIPFSNSWQHF